MDANQEKIVVLFANISESKHLYELMDDIPATNMIKKCLSLMQEVTQNQMGDVLNIFGDKVNCIFWDATSAVLAAKGMHEAIEDYIINETDDRISINLHIGIHSGPVQKEGNEIFGDTVNIVAMVTKIAKPREILITEQVFNELEDTLKPSARQTKTIKVKGNSTPINLYEFVWEDYDTTVAIAVDKINALKTVKDTCLELKVQDRVYEITYQESSLKLGRQSQNDLVIHDKSISRFHALIELRNNRFVLKDQSINGTFVYPQDGESYYVKQAEAYLEGAGILCLGEDSGVDSPTAIHYRIKDAT